MKKGNIVVVGIVCLLGLGVGIKFPHGSVGVLNRISSYFVYPFLVVQKKVAQPITNYMKYRRTIEQLDRLVAVMQERQEQLVEENIQLKATLHYDEAVQELIEFKKRFNYPHAILTQVLSKQFSDQAHFFLVDAGSNRGIKKDMVAIYKNNLVGKVVQVYPWYSKVVLITDRTCKVASCCVATGAVGIHEGKNDDRCTMLNYVSHLSEVRDDDLVISSGDGLVVPRGFALGRISAHQRDDLLYHIQVAPLVDVRSIEHCLLIAKGLTNQEDGDENSSGGEQT